MIVQTEAFRYGYIPKNSMVESFKKHNDNAVGKMVGKEEKN